MTRRIWQTCAGQIFDWHDVFDDAFCCRGTGVLEFGNGTGLAGETAHSDGETIHSTWGNGVLRRGKWGI